MKSKTVNLYLSALAGAMILLTGCGGSGGGVSSSPIGGTAAPTGTAGGTLSGIAAKGLLANAVVTAFCGNSEAAADQLATGATDATGKYNLAWTAACAKPVLLVVTAGANTTMADEATGTNVTLPAGFKLRALVADPSITAIKNITPLTNMAVAVAGTSATLSKVAASNAEAAIISTVLGGDIGAYQATPLQPTDAAMATASADERKLATVLTAVSAFAQDGSTAAACGGLAGGTGARIQCAINALATQAAATVTTVSDAGYTVATSVPANTPATMLAGALAKITLGTSSSIITAAGPQKLASTVTADSAGSGALLASGNASIAAAAGAGGVVAITTASGIQAARDLFTSLKNDLLAISNGSSSGYLDQKVSAMSADFANIASASATSSTENLNALIRALELAYDAKKAAVPAGSSIQPLQPNTVILLNNNMVAETDGTGTVFRLVRSFGDGMNCNAQINSGGTLGKTGCYYGIGQPNVTLTATTFTGFHHSVEVVESATTSGTYTWQDFLASRTYTTTLFSNTTGYSINGNGRNVPDPTTSQVATSTAQIGTAVMAWGLDGSVSAGTLKGNIQPLVAGQDYSTLDITGMSSLISSTSQVNSLTGTVTNVKGTATTLSMTLGSGSQVVGTVPVPPSTSDHPITGKLVIQLRTTAFQYDGVLSVNAYTANAIGQYNPTNASFTGKISTLANGAATEFLSGTLGATIANMSAYHPNLPDSATNFLKQTVTFGGKVTNGATAYELTFIADGSVYNQESVTLNYARTGSQMISVTGTASPTANTLTLHGTGDVNAVLTNGAGDVFTGTTKVGSITQNPSQVNFVDGTYLLLGI